MTFNEFQVAPYASGPQTVVVLYAQLRGCSPRRDRWQPLRPRRIQYGIK